MAGSPEVAYRALPQQPDFAEELEAPARLSASLASLEHGFEHEEDLDLPEVPDLPQEQKLDSRIKWVYFMLGNAVLLPWNAMITATPYFVSRLEGSPFKSTFGSYLTTTFTIANFVFLAHATVTSKESSRTLRVRHGTLWLALSLFVLTATTYVHMAPGLFFAFVMLSAVVQAAAGSYLQASVVAVASLFGPAAIQAVMTGQAVVAVLISSIQLASATGSVHTTPGVVPITMAEGAAEEKSAFAFFGVSTLFLLATVAAHAWLCHLPAYKEVVVPFEQHSKVLVRAARERRRSLSLSGSLELIESQTHRLKRVAKVNVIYCLAVAYVFVVTLAVFPPITVSILPNNPSVHPLVFSSLHFLMYNIGDYLGRYICAFPRLLIWSARRLLTLALVRTLFIPLFLMCNIQISAEVPSPPVINSDVLYMLLLLLFGLSSGYISTLCMMSAPSLEHNKRLKDRQDDVDTAATLSSFALVGGLVLGSVASFAVRSAVCGGCNPFTQH